MQPKPSAITIVLLWIILSLGFVHADFIFKNNSKAKGQSSGNGLLYDPNGDGIDDVKIDVGGNLLIGGNYVEGGVAARGGLHVAGDAKFTGNVYLGGGSLDDGLVGWWSFDETDSSGNIIDHSNFSHSGVPTGTVATGGTVTYTQENGVHWTVHTFTSDGTFTVTSPGSDNVEYLIVGGGGGGGGSIHDAGSGGGGGGGSFLTGSTNVAVQAYAITIGAGGSGGLGGSDQGADNRGGTGGNSIFAGVTAAGGGGGGRGAWNGDTTYGPGKDGASGGGGGGAQSGGTGTPGGNGGTANDTGTSAGAGGGGGASTAGANGTSTTAGDGGAGLSSSISGNSIFYAGGGGGGKSIRNDASPVSQRGDGGSGGGGNGGYKSGGDVAPVAGTANTGGGGGGGGAENPDSGAQAGAAGGSGIVIIRYKTSGRSPAHVTGKFSKAYTFDGTDDYIEVSETVDLEPNIFTLSLWVKKNSEPANNARIIEKRETGSPNKGWSVLFNNSSPRSPYISIYNTDNVETSTSSINTSLAVNVWRHCVFTFNGMEINAYEDGLLMGSNTFVGSLSYNDKNLFMGRGEDGNNVSPISLDEVKFYKRALNAKEVAELYRSESSYYGQGGTMSGNVAISGNAVIEDVLHFATQASAPSSPSVGEMYSDGGNLFFYDGSVWKDTTFSGNVKWPLSSGNIGSSGSGNQTMIGSSNAPDSFLEVDNASGSNDIFSVRDNGSEVLVVKDGGNIGVGTSSPSYKLDVNGSVNITGDLLLSGNLNMGGNILLGGNQLYNLGSTDLIFNTMTMQNMYITSDRRKKTAIMDIKVGQKEILQLEPVTYKFKHDLKQQHVGLIAQDVLKVLPKAVRNDEHTMGVRYFDIIPVLIKSHQEKRAKLLKQIKEFEALLDKEEEVNRQLKIKLKKSLQQ